MKLLLTSVSISPLKELTTIPYRDLRLVYIPTAADPYEDKWFIEEDRKRFRQMGIRFQELDIKGKTSEELLRVLRPAHAVFVSGGNTFYLLEKARESGFDTVIRKVVNDGVIYIGGSAGAVIAGPTIEPVSRLDDPSVVPHLTSFDGFNLVDFVVLPHYGKEKDKAKYEAIMDEFGKKNLKLLPLRDDQAVIVDDHGYRVVKAEYDFSAQHL